LPDSYVYLLTSLALLIPIKAKIRAKTAKPVTITFCAVNNEFVETGSKPVLGNEGVVEVPDEETYITLDVPPPGPEFITVTT
jgi:hypothetical protein